MSSSEVLSATQVAAATVRDPSRSLGIRALRFLLRDKALLGASVALLVLVALGFFGPMLWPKGALSIDLGSSLQPPSVANPMGTDGVGRDVFARFNQGARISLVVGTVVVVIGAVLGGIIGLISGMAGGWIDNTLMRAMDAILAFPPLILVMAATVGLGIGLTTAAIGITLTSIPWYARLVRSEVLRIKFMPFIEAATAIGASRVRIVGRHVVPHVISTLLIQAAAVFGYAILTLAALGFVGLGAQIPTPEWGAMITDGLQYALTGQWWIGVFPGLGVLIAVTAASVIADRCRDIFDPRGRYAQV